MILFHAGNHVRLDIDYYPNEPNRAGERGIVTGIREELQWGPRVEGGKGALPRFRVITLEVELREPIPDESEASS